MTLHVSLAVANARLNAIETIVSTSPIVRIFDGTMPANCAAADAGTNLWEEQLASDWAAAASANSKGWNNLPITGTVDNSGTPQYYRLYDSAGTTCHEQGTITITGGGGDMTVDSVTWTSGQEFQITAKAQSDGNYP